MSFSFAGYCFGKCKKFYKDYSFNINLKLRLINGEDDYEN